MKAHAPSSLAALDRARDISNERRSTARALGRAWACAWRERNRAKFDRIEAAGCFLPAGLGR